MNDVNAMIGMTNLEEVNENVIEKHKSNAKFYDDNLKNVPGVTLLKRDSRMESSFWIYSLLVDNKEKFAEHMKKHGIMTSQVHERNDIHSCLADFKSHLPNLDKIKNKLTAIPVGWWVTEDEREYIVNCIKKGW
jgi:dTDP-4-amino-4,6-dideoxygalactose transaminase